MALIDILLAAAAAALVLAIGLVGLLIAGVAAGECLDVETPPWR